MNDEKPKTYIYDMIVFGAGIAGLWLANTLKRAGYNVIVIEKDKVGGVQTLASQGMIHGGQKYVLQGAVTGHASSLAKMPERWDSSFDGYGEIDLTSVKFLSEAQVMWPAGSVLSTAAVMGAAKLVNASTKKLKREEFPEPLAEKKKFKGPVFELPEKVLEVKSLVEALAKKLEGRLLQGDVTEILPDGQVAVNGMIFRAQLVIFTAGTGNETALDLLRVKDKHAQRRPLRQVMVRRMEHPLYGHGITASPKPRLTVTSHPLKDSGFVWYLGGAIAEAGATLSAAETIAFAKSELKEVFPDIDWDTREWATWAGDRAEPFDAKGDLPPGPFVHQRGKVLMAWPTKLTFAPALTDRVFEWLKDKDIHPIAKDAPPPLPKAEIGQYPWETAEWSAG
ncbi:MAG TPA: FAD-dependent oxidoreductase [Patescibacteria group bacterium]|nr:FAD-dependent oxidoreductase [Patescibacteria group bacterium]